MNLETQPIYGQVQFYVQLYAVWVSLIAVVYHLCQDLAWTKATIALNADSTLSESTVNAVNADQSFEISLINN